MPAKKKTENTEQPMDRAFAVLGTVVAQASPVSVTDIAAALDLPVPTAHRLVAQLEKRGLLKRALGSKKVLVGEALVRLGVSAVEAAMRTDRPHQILLALSANLGEHVQVGVRSDNDVLYVDTARVPLSGPGLMFEQGRRAPLHCTSIGKLFLAEMPDKDFAHWLAQMPLPAATPHTITKRTQFKAAIAQVRKTGWATTDEEFAAGVVGCAVPIRRRGGQLVAGLGLSVPSARISLSDLAPYRAQMEAAAKAIAAALAE
jgi:IclR family transcriptional regulator, acetate operon repressor